MSGKPIDEAVRYQFETWARPKWRHREDFDQRIGAPHGTYNNLEVQSAWEAWQALTAAQQQQRGQAQPPSAPVGVEWTDERIIAACKAAGVRWIAPDDEEGGFPGGFDITHMPEMRRLFAALAKQPAAVDGGVAQRAAKALLDARSYIGPERPDDPDDVDSAEWWDELTELAAALAPQHQEPKS